MLRATSRHRFAPSLAGSASRLEDRMVLSMAPAAVGPPITMPPSPAPGHQAVSPPITMPPSPAPGGHSGASETGPVASPPIIGIGPFGN